MDLLSIYDALTAEIGLITGKTYTLRETVAPEGYLVTTDITFTIDENGNVTTTGHKTVDEKGNTVILVEDARTHIEVKKIDIANGEEVEGAEAAAAAVAKAAAAGAEGEEDEEEKTKLHRGQRFASLIPVAGTVVLFLLTQDMSAPMTIFDNWTLAFAGITCVNGVLTYTSRKKSPEAEEEAAAEAAAEVAADAAETVTK